MVWNHEIQSLFQMEKQSGINGIALLKPTSVDDLATLNSVIRLMAQEKGGEVYLFFSCNGSGRYLGLARMKSICDFNKSQASSALFNKESCCFWIISPSFRKNIVSSVVFY